MRALDSAFPGWTIAELKAADIVAVGRYLAFLPNGKAITLVEYVELIANGIAVFLVWESSGKSYLGGYGAGYTEGAEARRQARSLGHPDDCIIYQAVDTDAVMSNTLADYQRGFNEGGGCGLQGAYGDVAIGEGLLMLDLIAAFWETNARGWAGDAIDDPRAVLVQRYAEVVPGISGSYDVDDVFAVDFGQNPRPVAPPVVKPTPPVPPVQHPTVYVGDVAVHLTLISGIHLDTDGNGEVAVKGVEWQHVNGIVVIGGNNPNGPKPGGGRYDKTPTARVVGDSSPALIVIEGGEPSGTYSLNVSSV